MYQTGDYVVYGTYGLCRVTNVGTLDMDGVPKDRLYYFLTPETGMHGTVYTPADNVRVSMRSIMTKDMAVNLIRESADMKALDITGEKLREEKYKECIRSCDGKEWFRLILTIRDRMRERAEQGKKITALDERYMKLAEEYLYAELAVSLGISRDEVPGYIENIIK